MKLALSGDAEFDDLVNTFINSDDLTIVEVGKLEQHQTGWSVEVTLQCCDGIYHYFTLYHNDENGYGFTCDSFESKDKNDFWGVMKRPDGICRVAHWD